jgi:amidophosphoribosyltransferase
LYRRLRDEGIDGNLIPDQISALLDVENIVQISAQAWDGGYAIVGVIGNGDMFVMRDPHGIRPCHMLITEDVIAFASERVPLMTVFEVEADQIKSVDPGSVITIKADGTITDTQFHPPQKFTPCSFEKIYFSRGNDPQIYRERKAMGCALVDQVVASIGECFDKTVFSFIPNTAETAYHGMMDGLRLYRRQQVRMEILEGVAAGTLTPEKVDELILRNWPRGEKIAHKDIKMRTFISQEKGRDQLVSHVYDITYGSVRPGDNLVCVDDSIVRGTTLRKSILRILTRLNPKKIVIVSTAPQIRYPDCYGIDMSELGKFVAFEAAVALLKERGQVAVLDEVHALCVAELAKPTGTNHVRKIYESFTPEEISAEIVERVRPADIEWKGEIEIIFQTIEHLHAAVPEHTGDWYFTGRYPTPGGYRVVNQAFLNYFEKSEGRSY